MDICEGDREFARNLAEVFLETGREGLRQMAGSIATGQNAEVSAAAHKLKGSALAIAAESLARLCGELEVASSETGGPPLGPLSGRIRAEFDQVESALRPLVEG